MKKLNVILLLIALCCTTFAQAQEDTEKKESKFSIMAFGGIGYGIVDNENEPNYNVNANVADLVVSYKISDNIGVATGAGYSLLSGNGFNAVGNFYHERVMVKIPALVVFDCALAEKFRFLAHLGPYAQTIYKDEYTYTDFTVDDVYEGWNFGFQLGLSFVYELKDCFSLGINYSGQSDFTNLETNDDLAINGEQRMKNLNTIGLMFIFNL